MRIKEIKIKQNEGLRDICKEKGVNFKLLEKLLNSAKSKKMLKRNNYHQQNINDVIERAIS